ncbi:hypothetical protein H4R35_002728 [Dimargaris xerosporica]|nr:hypothetical protein H4R35_002728 [Dimargaris xerosporica]
MLDSDDLLQNFENIINQASAAQQGNQGTNSENQTLMTTGDAQSMNPRAFLYQFWLEVIGGGEIEQLRYYLTNVLL